FLQRGPTRTAIGGPAQGPLSGGYRPCIAIAADLPSTPPCDPDPSYAQGMDCRHQRCNSVAGFRSLRLDTGLLDDRPPFLDLGLLKRGEPHGCLLLARKDFLAEVG